MTWSGGGAPQAVRSSVVWASLTSVASYPRTTAPWSVERMHASVWAPATTSRPTPRPDTTASSVVSSKESPQLFSTRGSPSPGVSSGTICQSSLPRTSRSSECCTQTTGTRSRLDGVQCGPRLVEVRLDGGDPVGDVESAGLELEAVEQPRGDVQGGHRGSLEPLEQRKGSGSGAGADIQDPAAGRVGSQLVDPGGHLGQVRVKHLGVEVQELGHGRLVVVGRVVRVVLGVIMVRDCRAPTPRTLSREPAPRRPAGPLAPLGERACATIHE